MMRGYMEILREMTQKYTEETGIQPQDASDIGVRMKVLAHQIFSLENALDLLEQELFPETAQGLYLDKHAQQRGLLRKEGSCANGMVVFVRQGSTAGNVVIPKGTLVSTLGAGGLRYATQVDVLLAAGTTQVAAEVVCLEQGTSGNAAIGAVRLLLTPIVGVGSVDNLQPISGGTDGESDSGLRGRLLESYRNISGGTNAAFYLKEALGFEGIGTAAVLPRKRGRGTVDVVVYGNQGAASASVIAALQAEMAQKREVNVDVLVKAAAVVTLPVSIELAVARGWSFAQVQTACRAAMTAHFATFGIGQAFLLSGLTSLLMAQEGVANCKILAPLADLYPLENQILKLGTLTVALMAVQGG